MLVDDGIAVEMSIARDVEGDPYEVPNAYTMLNFVAVPCEIGPHDVAS